MDNEEIRRDFRAFCEHVLGIDKVHLGMIGNLDDRDRLVFYTGRADSWLKEVQFKMNLVSSLVRNEVVHIPVTSVSRDHRYEQLVKEIAPVFAPRYEVVIEGTPMLAGMTWGFLQARLKEVPT